MQDSSDIAKRKGISFLTKGIIPQRFLDLFAQSPDRILAQIGLVSLSDRYWKEYEPGTPDLSIQDFADLSREIVWGEGFLNELDVFLENTMLNDGIIRVAGHIEHLYLLVGLPNPLHKLWAAHFGHDHIRQDQVQGFLPAFRHE